MQQNNAKEILELAETISLLGTWELDLQTKKVIWSDGAFKMCGYQPNEFEITLESGLAIIHPNDQALAVSKMNDAIENEVPYEIRKRFITKDNQIIHILSKGKLIKDKDGKSIKLCGVFQDITSSVKLEEEYQSAINDLKSRNNFIETIVENLPIGIAVNKISTGEATMLNSKFAETYGWTDKDIKDIASFFEKVYPNEAYRKEIMARIMSDIESGDPARMNWENIAITTSKNENKIISAKNIPLLEQDLMISTVADMTERASLFEQIKNQQAELTALIENTDDTIYSVDMDFHLLTFNTTFAKFIKKSNNLDIKLGENVFNYYNADRKDFYLSIFEKVKDGESYFFENTVKFQNQITYFDVLVNPIIDSDHVQRGYSIFAKDITAKKIVEIEKEEAIQNYNRIMDSSLDVICTIDERGCFLNVSKAAFRVWGYHPQELIGKSYADLVYSEDHEKTNKVADEIRKGIDITNFENRYIRKDGEIIYIEWSVKWNADDKIMYAIARDISEQKKNEEKLRLSEQYFKSLIQEGSDLIAILDQNGNFIYVAPTTANILGLTSEFILGKNSFAHIHRDDLAIIQSQYQSLAPQKRIKLPPYRFQYADGTWHWLESIVTNLLEDPAVKGMVTNSRDVTERIRNEKALQRSNELLKNAQRISSIGNWEYHYDTKQFSCSEEVYRILEIEDTGDGKLTFVDFTSFIHPDDLKEFSLQLKKLEKSKTPLNLQHRILTKNKNFKYVKQLGEAIFDAEQNKYLLFGTIRDNTEAISNQLQIQKSESQYKQLFEDNPVPMMLWDFETKNIVDCNDEALEQYGYTRTEFLKLSIFDIRPEEDVQLIKDATKDVQSYGYTHKNVWRHLKKNGELMYVYVSGHIIEYNNRKSSLVMLIDMTSQIKAEEQKEFEKRDKEALINSADDLIWSVSPNLKLIAANDAFIKNIHNKAGITIKPGDDILELPNFPKVVLDDWINGFQKAFSGVPFKSEFYAPSINNHPQRWSLVTINPIYDLENKITGVACFSKDITAIKLAELNLKKNQDNLAEAQRLAKLGSWEFDIKNQKFNWSKELFHIMDIDEATFHQNKNDSFIHLIDPEFQEQAYAISKKIKETGEDFIMEYGITTAKGEKKILLEMGYAEKDKKGKIIRFFGTVQDITERKLAEDQVKESERKYRAFFENSMDGILLTSPDGAIYSANPAACEIFQMTVEEIIEKGRFGLVDKEDPRLNLLLNERQTSGRARSEMTMIKKDGTKFEGELASIIYKDSNNKERTSTIVRDITLQKNAEENLKKAFKEKNEILESIGDAFFAIDHEWTVTYWNKQAEKMLGISKKKIIGHYLWNVFPDRMDSEIYIKYHQAMTEHTLIRFENYFEKLNSWYEVSIYPSNYGLSVYLKDISERISYTKAIEEKNTKLREIAYTQSHIVRAPLARIMGLINLIEELKVSTAEGKELLNYINISANELDEVIKDIVSKTEDI